VKSRPTLPSTLHAWTCIRMISGTLKSGAVARVDYQIGSSRHQRQASELAETQMTARNARNYVRHKIGNTPRMPTQLTRDIAGNDGPRPTPCAAGVRSQLETAVSLHGGAKS
jgi:hypothetical protein